MSDVAPGPGWWRASDGNWYPPPQPPGPETVRPGEAPDAPATAAVGSGGSRGLPSRRWIMAAAAVVVVASGVGLGVAFSASSPSGSSLPTGSQQAAIEVSLPTSGQPSFSGQVAGRPLTGRVVAAAGGGASPAAVMPAFTYEGRYASQPYVLHVAFSFSGGGANNPTSSPAFSFVVTGTYGTEAVAATARFDFAAAGRNPSQLTVPFSGHVGSQRVSGTATATETRGRSLHIAARFTVR